MPYTQTTLAQFTADLSTALLDPGNVHWQADEIQRAVREGLLVWGALTAYWNDRGIFSTTVGTPFYDLSVQLPALRTRTQTFDNLAREVEYHLYEQAAGLAGTGMTAQFTVSQLTTALTRARNQFIIDARLPLSDLEIPSILPSPPSGRAALPENIALISHAWWKDAPTGIWSPLRRIDPWAEDSFLPDWPQLPSRPFAYSIVETPPLTIQFFPQPSASGALSAISAQTIDYVGSPPNSSTVLNLPDEYSPAVKWGALYSMLSTDNEAYDPLRSAYAKQRWDSLVGAAEATMRSVIRVRVADVPTPLDTVWAMDATMPSWRNITGTPRLSACAFDLLMLAPIANQAYSLTVDVSRTAPLPFAGTDAIQMGVDELPYLFDYCRHILSFKLGGTEFTSTMPLYDNFLKGAKQRGKIQSDRSTYLTPLFGQPRKEADQFVPA